MTETLKVLRTKTTFYDDVERMCATHGVDVLDAIVTWCERHHVEVDSVASWINKDGSLKARLQAEGETARTIKVIGGRLPI